MRKTGIVKIEDPASRDSGKVFVLKEMPAAVAERWATRALLALARSGIDLPENIAGAGWAGIAMLGFQALSKMDFADVQPLLDEMWACVSIRPDQRQPEVIRPLMWAGPDGEGADIEEISTMIKLRTEVFTLHTGFSIPGAGSTSSTQTTPGAQGGSPSTTMQTPSSAAPLRRSSPPGKRR